MTRTRSHHAATAAQAAPGQDRRFLLVLGLGLLALVVAYATGCGGRTLYNGGDGGTNNANGNQNQNQNHNGNQNNNNVVTGECQTPDDCVVATKADACCACPEAASAADLAADPCLIPEGDPWREECTVECPAIECPPCPTLGRTADCQQHQCVLKEGQCTEDEQCVTAIRTDNCCEQAFPATVADVEADPCLTYWPMYWYDIPEECMQRWDPVCALIDCAPSPPTSRAVTCGSDGCGFVPECQTPQDCRLMTNYRECCPCPTAWPASMAGHDPCVVPLGTTVPVGCMPEACADVLCEACEPPPGMGCDVDYGCYDQWLGGGI